MLARVLLQNRIQIGLVNTSMRVFSRLASIATPSNGDPIGHLNPRRCSGDTVACVPGATAASVGQGCDQRARARAGVCPQRLDAIATFTSDRLNASATFESPAIQLATPLSIPCIQYCHNMIMPNPGAGQQSVARGGARAGRGGAVCVSVAKHCTPQRAGFGLCGN